MKYELKIPAICGDVISLRHVASEMARAASTAYGRTSPHEPIYDGQLPIHTKSLLNEARAGRLRVCNQLGYQGTVEELIAAAKSSGDLSEVSRYLVEPDWERLHQENPPLVEGIGVWDFTGVDLGPSEIDWDATYIGCLHAKLHHLNEWGKTNGDEFTISSDSVEWIDERGVMRPTEASSRTAKPLVPAGASDEKPWLVADNRDPKPDQHWYTPARYFARNLVIADSTLLAKKLMLADKVSQALKGVGILKRGGKNPLAADTVLKAFSNVILG